MIGRGGRPANVRELLRNLDSLFVWLSVIPRKPVPRSSIVFGISGLGLAFVISVTPMPKAHCGRSGFTVAHAASILSSELCVAKGVPQCQRSGGALLRLKPAFGSDVVSEFLVADTSADVPSLRLGGW